MKNYSRQREAIKRALCSTDTHPTAKEVYDIVRKEIPNISLGTVYRNLAALRNDGAVLSITVTDGFEHFDGDTRPHLHLHCRRCGHIADAPLSDDRPLTAVTDAGFTPDSEVYIVYGVCAECKKCDSCKI